MGGAVLRQKYGPCAGKGSSQATEGASKPGTTIEGKVPTEDAD